MQGKGQQEKWARIARVARPRNASVLAYSRCYGLFSLESGMPRNGPVPFGKGATEKVRKEPRRCPTSFGKGRLETCRKATRWPPTSPQMPTVMGGTRGRALHRI